MLTKELLRYRLREGQVKPFFLKAWDKEALENVQKLLAVFAGAAGLTLEALQEKIREALPEVHDDTLWLGIAKILKARLTLAEDDDEIMTFRWQALLASQSLREKQDLSADTFQHLLSEKLALPWEEMKARLYGDLPDKKMILSYDPLTPEELRNRYNVALAQSLLIFCQKMTVRAAGLGALEARQLLRSLKFHQLLFEPGEKHAAGNLELLVSGPLSIFDAGNAYGVRMANFFPALLHIPGWSLEASLKLKGRQVELKLSAADSLKSLKEIPGGYLPEELTAFSHDFAKAYAGWKVEEGGEYIHLGQKSYCVSDFKLVSKKGKSLHVELFHRWHKHQFVDRLKVLEKSPHQDLRLGVCSRLLKDPHCKKALSESNWFENNGFKFQDFPTCAQIKKIMPETVGAK